MYISVGKREFALTHLLSTGPPGRPSKVLKHWELLPGCFCAVQDICRKLTSSEVTLLSLGNDCWDCRSGFSHPFCGTSESMNGRTDQRIASICITVALRELCQAQDLTEVLSTHSQRWDLPKRPCSPVGKTVGAHTIILQK